MLCPPRWPRACLPSSAAVPAQPLGLGAPEPCSCREGLAPKLLHRSHPRGSGCPSSGDAGAGGRSCVLGTAAVLRVELRPADGCGPEQPGGLRQGV